MGRGEGREERLEGARVAAEAEILDAEARGEVRFQAMLGLVYGRVEGKGLVPSCLSLSALPNPLPNPNAINTVPPISQRGNN